MALHQDRQELRAAGRTMRRNMQALQRSSAESSIGFHLDTLAIPATATVGVYVADDGEPDLTEWTHRHVGAGGVVALPVPEANRDSFAMEFRPWHVGETLMPGRFGIPCPPPREALEPDVVLVPLVRFDASGNRLGRGGGFYDRFLAPRSIRTIGIAFEGQRAEALPTQAHDVPLAVVVTELGVRFSQTAHSARE